MLGNHLHGNDHEVALPDAGIVASSKRRQCSGERRTWLASPPSLLPVARRTVVRVRWWLRRRHPMRRRSCRSGQRALGRRRKPCVAERAGASRPPGVPRRRDAGRPPSRVASRDGIDPRLDPRSAPAPPGLTVALPNRGALGLPRARKAQARLARVTRTSTERLRTRRPPQARKLSAVVAWMPLCAQSARTVSWWRSGGGLAGRRRFQRR